MFKNRALEVKVVKNSEKETPRPNVFAAASRRDIEHFNKMFLNNVKVIAILGGAGYALRKTVDTASEIAIIAAKAKIQ